MIQRNRYRELLERSARLRELGHGISDDSPVLSTSPAVNSEPIACSTHGESWKRRKHTHPSLPVPGLTVTMAPYADNASWQGMDMETYRIHSATDLLEGIERFVVDDLVIIRRAIPADDQRLLPALPPQQGQQDSGDSQSSSSLSVFLKSTVRYPGREEAVRPPSSSRRKQQRPSSPPPCCRPQLQPQLQPSALAPAAASLPMSGLATPPPALQQQPSLQPQLQPISSAITTSRTLFLPIDLPYDPHSPPHSSPVLVMDTPKKKLSTREFLEKHRSQVKQEPGLVDAAVHIAPTTAAPAVSVATATVPAVTNAPAAAAPAPAPVLPIRVEPTVPAAPVPVSTPVAQSAPTQTIHAPSVVKSNVTRAIRILEAHPQSSLPTPLPRSMPAIPRQIKEPPVNARRSAWPAPLLPPKPAPVSVPVAAVAMNAAPLIMPVKPAMISPPVKTTRHWSLDIPASSSTPMHVPAIPALSSSAVVHYHNDCRSSGRGRGASMTLPAWMTAPNGCTAPPDDKLPPSHPRQPLHSCWMKHTRVSLAPECVGCTSNGSTVVRWKPVPYCPVPSAACCGIEALRAIQMHREDLKLMQGLSRSAFERYTIPHCSPVCSDHVTQVWQALLVDE